MKDIEVIELIENDDAWDTGNLGQDINSAKSVELTPEQQQAIDDAVGLQMISIRLPKSLIDDFKFIGEANGIKYQTLMRQCLSRFAHTEMKHMARKAASTQKAARQEMDDTEHPPEKKRRKAA